MKIRNVYLKIEAIRGYSPVIPDSRGGAGRDCMRNAGHSDGTIPLDEAKARRLDALVYQEYLDHHWLVPKPDKIVFADVNEPPFHHRIPGAVIYARPGDRLRIHVLNADTSPHSFHLHGLSHGIDSDGAWPFGTQSSDGRRSDEICPGQTWTYTFDVRDEMMGAWPFHDHYRGFVHSVERGLFGGVVVLSAEDYDALPRFPLPKRLIELLKELEHHSPSVNSMAAAGDHTGGVHDLPAALREQVLLLEELMHSPQLHLIPKPPLPLHVPIFLHRMSGVRSQPLFESAPLKQDEQYISPPFTFPAVYNYHCGIHGRSTSGRISVKAGGSSVETVEILANGFLPANVEIGVGGRVRWISRDSDSSHSVVELGGDNLPSHCFNGRCFTGNTPTILAVSGQKIRWHVFNLDLGTCGHNFHPHGQKWRFADETVDVRSLGPAESFAAETKAPPALLLTPDIERYEDAECRTPDAEQFRLRGDFLFHCNTENHLREGMVGLVRASQTVWLTSEDARKLQSQSGLPLDRGDNDCPAIALDRCANSVTGKWVGVCGVSGFSMMHAVLLPNSQRVLFWGYGPRKSQTCIWALDTEAYSQPSPQPQEVTSDENIWSGAHAHLSEGKVLVHGGFKTEETLTPETERRTLFFDPGNLAWSSGPDTNARRFYPTTITLADGRLLTLFGQNTTTGDTAKSLEVFDSGPPPVWGRFKDFPPSFNYQYYPWTFLLPNGDLFIAGPQQPSRRVDWIRDPIEDKQEHQFVFTIKNKNGLPIDRGENMNGTAVLLPLEPPNYEPRVLVAGAKEEVAQKTAEWIDLSEATPRWKRLPDMNVARNQVTSVILPDGRVFVAGGTPSSLSGGGPVELFDPEDPEADWQLGPAMEHGRRYHSAAILLPDGSVLMGGDTTPPPFSRDGEGLPHERYLPSYFFKPRPEITSAPASVAYGECFTIETPRAKAIGKVVLIRPGAVTHGFDMSQRSVRCHIDAASGTSVVAQAPPHGNVAPPGYYLLFLVDGDRVPSTGVWIRVEKPP